MRIVLDTNVLMSGIFWSGPPFEILKAWKQGKISLVVSQAILSEYMRVAEILSEKYPLVDLAPFLELLTMYAELQEPIKLSQAISRDPDDEKFIACALAAKVRWIVSGDKDLLSIPNDIGVEVITPSEFVKELLHSV
jgi:uncharacterized protein